MTSNSQLHLVALAHRVKAINGLNAALSTPPKTRAGSDAIAGACYALAIQTSYIGYSVEEFLTMLRGCRLVTGQEWYRKLGTSFKVLRIEDQLESVSERLRCVPTVDERFTSAARSSLEQLQPSCSDDVETKILGWMLDVVEACETSSRNGK